MHSDFQADIDAIQSIDVVPTILDVVCRATGMGFAAVARVTSDRWVTCSAQDNIGLGLTPGSELKIETTICLEVHDRSEAVIIDNVADDGKYRDHPTPALYGFQSYISMPIVRRDGRFFGTLCAIDPRPARLENAETIGMFRMFADLIAFHLEAHERVADGEAALLDERKTSDLREQFIAILSHDLRNPLASIGSGLRLLQREQLTARGDRVVALMRGSVDRMAGLIDDMLDLARSRLAGGIGVTLGPVGLASVLTQLVEEQRLSHPGRQIDLDMAFPETVDCDQGRIAQLVSNLLGNALTHGSSSLPVNIKAVAVHEDLELTVSNGGEAIPSHDLERLFQPFVRGGNSHDGGLGLGLYIASEIARAHGGTLNVVSDAGLTCFTVRMPLSGVLR